MEVFRQIADMREAVRRAKRNGRRVGLVPTMGYLHDGHLSLVNLAAQQSDFICASIFVNPAQFNDPGDLAKYPRDIDRDISLLEQTACQAIFLPDAGAMYSESFQSWASVELLSAPLEGALRPGHFRGVTTVVSMLFNICDPDIAVFGEKDFQQLRVIEQMVKDLKFGVDIVRAPLIREPDGLAMSSRNVRLSSEDRRAALAISRGLMEAAAACRGGERDASALVKIARSIIVSDPALSCEYIQVVNEKDLKDAHAVDQPARMLAAVKVGGVRLIDNIALKA